MTGGRLGLRRSAQSIVGRFITATPQLIAGRSPVVRTRAMMTENGSSNAEDTQWLLGGTRTNSTRHPLAIERRYVCALSQVATTSR